MNRCPRFCKPLHNHSATGPLYDPMITSWRCSSQSVNQAIFALLAHYDVQGVKICTLEALKQMEIIGIRALVILGPLCLRGKHMMASNFEVARKAMIDSQIRPNKVIDERVIEAFSAVPREAFVPRALRDVAYVDEDLSLSGGRFIVEAMVMARLLQALSLQPEANVLLIGAGTGYSAALLSHLCASVIAIDNRSAAVEKAQDILGQMEIGNVAVLRGKLTEGCPKEGPYDAIIIEGGVEVMPQALLEQLAPNGQCASIWRSSPTAQGEASLWSRAGGQFVRRSLFNAQVPSLNEFKAKAEFTF